MTRPARSSRILLVDDSDSDIELTVAAFDECQSGHVIDVARSGQEALDRLRDSLADVDGRRCPLPDLILLDLNMPGIDGFEVLHGIKSLTILRRIPVAILTSSREAGDRARAYDAGANSFLVKPVAFGDMLHIVELVEAYWLTINAPPPLEHGTVGDRVPA